MHKTATQSSKAWGQSSWVLTSELTKQSNIWHPHETYLTYPQASPRTKVSPISPFFLLSFFFSLLSHPYRANDGIISPHFLQGGSILRLLSTSRGTLQLWLQLFCLSSRLMVKHSADKFRNRVVGQMPGDGQDSLMPVKFKLLFQSKCVSKHFHATLKLTVIIFTSATDNIWDTTQADHCSPETEQ